MKVLIFSLSTGQGHNSASEAIKNYLIENNAECKIVDAYKDISKFLGQSVEKGYLVSTKHVPVLYGKIYRSLEKNDKADKTFIPISIPNTLVVSKCIDIAKKYKADVIIAPHVFTALLLPEIKREMPDIKTIGIVTDFTIHPYWVNTDLDFYVTASHLLTHQCIEHGISEEKILPFGIPIRKQFSKSISKSEARKNLGIENRDTIMIMMGSMGYGNVADTVKEIDKLKLDFQILCVCGNNERIRKKLETLETAHTKYIYGFVDNVNEMMDAADFLVTKPGGLSTSESLAKGLPMILCNPIPGHEHRNIEFLVNNGLAVAVTDTYPIDEAVYQLMSNEWKRINGQEAIKYVGKPNAAKALGDFILSLKKE